VQRAAAALQRGQGRQAAVAKVLQEAADERSPQQQGQFPLISITTLGSATSQFKNGDDSKHAQHPHTHAECNHGIHTKSCL
jgi:hypothetical protein